MTRKQLNTVLIDAVKKSNELDSKFPPLKMFAEIQDITALHNSQLDVEMIQADTDLFYSSRAVATGRDNEVDFPALILIETGAVAERPFSGGNHKKRYSLQLIVAVPNTEDILVSGKTKIRKGELTKYCLEQLDFVLRFIWDYNENTGSPQDNKRIANVNENIQIDLNESYGGFALAFASIQFPECVTYNFVKNTRTAHCC